MASDILDLVCKVLTKIVIPLLVASKAFCC